MRQKIGGGTPSPPIYREELKVSEDTKFIETQKGNINNTKGVKKRVKKFGQKYIKNSILGVHF